MEVNQLATILRVLLDRHGNGQKNFTLLAFSMGARLALKLFEHFPDAINRLVLLAPDGLKMNRWYWLATQTVPGNRLFAYTMKNPGWFFRLMHFAAWMKLANSSIYKFTQQHINNPVVRKALFDRWTCMKKFTPSLVLIKKYIMQKKIPVRLLYGAHDRMIMPERGRKFMHGIETYCTLQVIDSGHQVLHEKNAKHIITLLEF